MSDPVEIALITAAGPIIATVVSTLIGWVVSRRAKAQIQEVHTIVNSQRGEMMAEIDRLKAEINSRSFPPDQFAPR